MAKRKITKKQERQIKKTAKKHPVLVAIVLLLVVAIIGCCVLHKKGIIHIPFLDTILPQEQEVNVDSKGGEFTEEDIQTIKGSNVSIHFLLLGNKYTGDSVLIKAGNTEVLIDAGSRQNSAGAIVDYVSEFCEDGKLEYVIATHADQDHIAGFVGTNDKKGVFESFECGTIIDFPRSNKTTQIYQKYQEERDAEVTLGATHYTALECWNEENGAKKSYTLAQGITMNFLYQKYYEEDTNDENDYSVCMLLSEETVNGTFNYLFTGDLEEHGEESLVESNVLPKCKLFKAGHHGSPTSSNSELLSVIQPEIVCVCCCCGSDEYTKNIANMFPSQAFVDRVAPYTSQVFVTTIVSDNEDGFEPLNGNIVVMSNNGVLNVRCSNNATLFKDTEWFKNNRTMPSAWK